MLYKYIKREHLVSFFKNGLLKIGTLYEYRDEEELGSTIGDEDEGVIITTLNLPETGVVDLGKNTPETDYFKKHFNLHPQMYEKHIKLHMGPGVKFNATSESQDYYIYCASALYDKAVMEDFECDSCIEILDTRKFFREITKKLKFKAEYEGLYNIDYDSITKSYKTPHTTHPALLKDLEYQNQVEVRALWQPKTKPKGSLYINVPKARKFCKEYKDS